ncbi:MAG TPA: TlpA disulfide reductase family protein [Chitinophagales bacterium]
MRKIKITFIVLLFVGLKQSASAQLNQPFPKMELTDIDGKMVNTAEFSTSGKITLVSFWAIWCAPCRIELNALRDASADWEKKYGVNIVAISIDDDKALEKVQKLSAEQKWNFPLWLDPGQSLKKTMDFSTVPYMVILDKKGRVRIVHTAFLDGDDNIIEEELARLYKE